MWGDRDTWRHVLIVAVALALIAGAVELYQSSWNARAAGYVVGQTLRHLLGYGILIAAIIVGISVFDRLKPRSVWLGRAAGVVVALAIIYADAAVLLYDVRGSSEIYDDY